MTPKCIILNGVSCSGVTAVATSLQKLIPNLLHVETRSAGAFYLGMFPTSYKHSKESKEWDEDRFTRRNSLNSISCHAAKMVLDRSMNVE